MTDKAVPAPKSARAPVPRLRNYIKPEPLDPDIFPHKPQNGSLPGTIDNLEHLLDAYEISVRYDVIQKKLHWNPKLIAGASDNADNTAMTHVVSLASLNRFPRGNVEAYVAAIADTRPYNPVKEWIQSSPWDGRDRLPEIYETLVHREPFPTALKEILVRKWLLSAVAAALLRKGFRGRGVLTLQGPQGIGKTQWVSSLVPDDDLRRKVVKLDHHLDAHNKDSIIGAISHWLCEIGELDSAMRKDVARLKGVLTRDRDKLRNVYHREESEMPRRTVFAATVNHAKFLVDDTGNSRWWVVPVMRVDWQHGIDMQQLFAQLALDLNKRVQWWLTEEEERVLDEHNRPHRATSAIEDMVLEAIDLDRAGDNDLPAMTPRQLLVLLGMQFPTNPHCKECAGVLREYLGDPKRIQGRERWRIPLTEDHLDRWNSPSRSKVDKYD